MICPTDYNTLKVFIVEKYIASLNIRDEIRINARESIDNFEVHPSLNYLLITTSDGVLRLFCFKKQRFVQENQMNMRIKGNSNKI